jgi:hypothetical protein
MREYLAYALILVIVAGIALAWRVSTSRRQRDHHSTRYRITPRADDEEGMDGGQHG